MRPFFSQFRTKIADFHKYKFINILKEKHSLKDYGACGENGFVEYFECPCGETASVSYSTDCMLSGNNTYYRDENGVHYVPKRSVEDLIINKILE